MAFLELQLLHRASLTKRFLDHQTLTSSVSAEAVCTERPGLRLRRGRSSQVFQFRTLGCPDRPRCGYCHGDHEQPRWRIRKSTRDKIKEKADRKGLRVVGSSHGDCF